MGQPIADFANTLFANNEYRDYLEVHGMGVQLTEALAEYWHARIRSELVLDDGTVGDHDATDTKRFLTWTTVVRGTPLVTVPAPTWNHAAPWWICCNRSALVSNCLRNCSCILSNQLMRLFSTTLRRRTLMSEVCLWGVAGGVVFLRVFGQVCRVGDGDSL